MSQSADRWASMYDVLTGELDASAIAGLICHACGADWASIAAETPDGRVMVLSSDFAPNLGTLYTPYYAERDPWRVRRPRVFDEMIVTESYLSESEWRQTEFYQDVLRPMGVDPVHGLTGAIRLNGHGEALIGIGQSRNRGPFTNQQIAIAHSALPHLKRVLKLRAVLDDAEAATAFAEASLDAFPTGLMRLDASGRLLYANRAAQAVIDRGDALTLRGGRLAALNEMMDTALREGIQAALYRTRSMGAPLTLPRGEGAEPYVMTLAPISRRGQSQALAMINAPEALANVRQAQLGAVYQLSLAETALVMGLMEGKSLPEIAESRGASINTLRVQLRSVLRKTGATRQAELVAQVSRLPMLREAG